MVKTLLRSALREIRQSMGRYLAILAIVGLGVGFFAGLRTCQPSMMSTGRDYLDRQQLYDFRLLSTLGFTQEDVEGFAALEAARANDPEKAKKYAQILMNQAKLIAGLPIDDPSGYTDLLCSLWS